MYIYIYNAHKSPFTCLLCCSHQPPYFQCSSSIPKGKNVPRLHEGGPDPDPPWLCHSVHLVDWISQIFEAVIRSTPALPDQYSAKAVGPAEGGW